MYTEKQILRFWGYVNMGAKDSCWEWTGALDHNGYGKFNVNKKIRIASRVAWEIIHGETELHVLHKCDNSKCCNPSHLFPGTHKQNMQDASQKKRLSTQKGRKWVRKMDWNKAQALRLRKKTMNTPILQLARMYDIAPKHVRDILAGKSWRQNQ